MIGRGLILAMAAVMASPFVLWGDLAPLGLAFLYGTIAVHHP